MTEEIVEVKYSDFYHNGRLYAWIKVPVEFLDEDAPSDSPYSYENVVYDDDGEMISGDLKPLKEFVLFTTPLEDSNEVLMSLARMDALTYRLKSVKEDDLTEWENFLTPLGYGVDTWLNVEARNGLLQTEEEL